MSPPAPAMTGLRRTVPFTVGLSVTAVAVATLPLFLTGSLAGHLQAELAFTATGLGVAIAAYRGMSAATVGLLGRWVDRLGATRSIRLAALLTTVACTGIALITPGWWALVGWLLVGACGRSLCQPAVNRLLVNRIRPEQRGMAFGIKQSGGPTASMLAGAAVPVLAVTLGWRAAFVAAALLAVLVLVAAGGRPRTATVATRPAAPPRSRLRGRATLAVLFVAFAVASGASSVLPAFYVLSASTAGTPASTAGTLLAAASVTTIGVRVLSGLACDRMVRGHLLLCTAMLGVGAGGTGLLATGSPALMGVGIIVALGGTWGFDGVFWYAVIRAYPGTPGQITGALEPAGLIGGAGTPLLFGALIDLTGYRVSWIAAALLSLLGALAMAAGARRLSHQVT